MQETISKILEAAKDNEEAKAVLSTINKGSAPEQVMAALKEAADKVGIDFDATELSDEALSSVNGGRSNFESLINWLEGIFGGLFE